MSSLDWIAARTLAAGMFFAAHDLFFHAHALYDAILPTSGFFHLFLLAKLGKASDRWFARKIPIRNWVEGKFHELVTDLMVFMGQRYGPGFPKPEPIDVPEIDRIVRWVEETRSAGTNCFITTVASSAVRIARVASQMGVSLQRTKISVAGEPLTGFKEQIIRDTGASITSRYSYGGAVTVGFGCANPSYRDEIHVSQDLLTIISHTRTVAGGDSWITPLLCTTVHPLAPRVLLNVENGDCAKLETRNCGCALQRVGYSLHLHHIRSFEKFTSEGMNYFYGDVYELFEGIFPTEFGGDPGHYQLVEEEDDNGQTRLTLIVHPEVGRVDERLLLARLQKALSVGPRSNRFMAELWEQAGTFRVKREAPYASARGKILPLYIKQEN